MPDRWFVLVAGWPGSGKSTLAAALAPRLGLPLLAKDEIKEAPDGCPDRPGAVLDSTWFGYALPLARALPGRRVEVHCVLPIDVARVRYQARHRHPGHLDAERADQELWRESPPALGLGPAIQVDTSAEVDLDQLITRLGRLLAR